MHGLRLASEKDGKLVDEIARGWLLASVARHVHAPRQVCERDQRMVAEERHLVLLGGQPFVGGLCQCEVEQHELPSDERWRGGAAIAVVVLPDRAVHRPGAHVIDVPAIDLELQPSTQLALDELIEEAPDILPILHAGKRGELPAHTEAAVQRDGDQKPRLAWREAEIRERLDAFVKRHHSLSRWRGSNGVPPVRALPPRTRPAPAAR